MNAVAEYTGEWVTCSCCGRDIHDTPETNLDYHERGQDTGYGHCTDCFGEPPKPEEKPTGKLRTEAECKRQLGWAGQVFYEARFDTLRKSLKGKQLEHFESMPYAKKLIIVARLIEKGYMI